MFVPFLMTFTAYENSGSGLSEENAEASAERFRTYGGHPLDGLGWGFNGRNPVFVPPRR
jgi:hypothetical protein